MAANREHSPAGRLLTVLAGIALVGAAFLLEIISEEGGPRPVQSVLVVGGCVFAALGIALRPGRVSAVLSKASLAILSVAFVLAMGEAIFRVVGYDFERLNKAPGGLPIY